MLIPQYLVLVLKLTPINMVSLNTVFSIPQNQCYLGTSCTLFLKKNSENYRNKILLTINYLSIGVEPNEDCKYIIDDVVFDEQQMLEMFGLIAMNGYPSESRRWPNGVLAYTIDTNTIASGSAEETRILQQITRFNNEMSGCLSIV